MPIEKPPARLTIRSGQGDYDVISLASAGDVAALIASVADAFVVADERVLDLHAAAFDGVEKRRVYVLPATETEKTLAGVERLCIFLQRNDASKRSTLVVVGGGIIQDIGMFAAHIYYRGIPAYYVPTTLLSMADSCIGAKCGLNLGEFKNQIGFFQAPRSVAIWSGFLATLAPDDVRSGFGEIVKLAIIAGRPAFDAVAKRLTERGFNVDGADDLTFASLETKRSVIEEDEYEKGVRKTLNYGHSFGHALEGLTHHEVPHGLAVAWGMDVANYVAMRKGLLAEADFDCMHDLLKQRFSLRVKGSYAGDDLLAMMRRDKKAAAGRVTLVLPKTFGDLHLVDTPLDSALGGVISDYIEKRDIFTR